MMKLGNKGQTLVLFVFLFPVMLLLLVFVIDCGRVMLEKKELDNVTEIVIRYGFANIDEVSVEDKMVRLFELNVSDADVKVNIDNDSIVVRSSKYVEGVFSDIINIKGFKIESSYRGEVVNDEIRIKKN